jgi:hypothetical protein
MHETGSRASLLSAMLARMNKQKSFFLFGEAIFKKFHCKLLSTFIVTFVETVIRDVSIKESQMFSDEESFVFVKFQFSSSKTSKLCYHNSHSTTNLLITI